MELFAVLVASILFIGINRYLLKKKYLKKLNDTGEKEDRFCVIDIRDYISAHRAPYPGAENIPLSYLSRALKERFDCPKEILVITDDERGARMAAKLIRKKQNKPIYYKTSVS